MFLPPVYQTLKASSAIQALLGGTQPRVYAHSEAPQPVEGTPAEAYVTWFSVNIAPENHLSGVPLSDRVTIQVDCWHPRAAGVILLAQAVRDALEPVAVFTAAPIDGRETETRLFRMALQFDWFNGRDPLP